MLKYFCKKLGSWVDPNAKGIMSFLALWTFWPVSFFWLYWQLWRHLQLHISWLSSIYENLSSFTRSSIINKRHKQISKCTSTSWELPRKCIPLQYIPERAKTTWHKNMLTRKTTFGSFLQPEWIRMHFIYHN